MTTQTKVAKTEKAEQAQTKQIGNIREILEQQLTEITKRKRLADNRQVFLTKKNAIQDFRKTIEEEKLNGSFDSSKFKISLTSAGYRDDDKISINNIDLIFDFLDLLDAKIDEYVEKIESELIG